LQKKAMVAFD